MKHSEPCLAFPSNPHSLWYGVIQEELNKEKYLVWKYTKKENTITTTQRPKHPLRSRTEGRGCNINAPQQKHNCTLTQALYTLKDLWPGQQHWPATINLWQSECQALNYECNTKQNFSSVLLVQVNKGALSLSLLLPIPLLSLSLSLISPTTPSFSLSLFLSPLSLFLLSHLPLPILCFNIVFTTLMTLW